MLSFANGILTTRRQKNLAFRCVFRLYPPMPSGVTPEDIFRMIGLTPVLTPHAARGFHGTSEEVADEICAHGFDFTKSKPGLFGKGAYFYEDVPHPGTTAATCFLLTRRSFSRIAVVAAMLSFELVFDLLTREENAKFFRGVQQKLIDLAAEQGLLSSLDVRIIGTATVEFIVTHCPSVRDMQAVRATFKLPSLQPPRQQGACVRDSKCITGINKIPIN